MKSKILIIISLFVFVSMYVYADPEVVTPSFAVANSQAEGSLQRKVPIRSNLGLRMKTSEEQAQLVNQARRAAAAQNNPAQEITGSMQSDFFKGANPLTQKTSVVKPAEPVFKKRVTTTTTMSDQGVLEIVQTIINPDDSKTIYRSDALTQKPISRVTIDVSGNIIEGGIAPSKSPIISSGTNVYDQVDVWENLNNKKSSNSRALFGTIERERVGVKEAITGDSITPELAPSTVNKSDLLQKSFIKTSPAQLANDAGFSDLYDSPTTSTSGVKSTPNLMRSQPSNYQSPALFGTIEREQVGVKEAITGDSITSELAPGAVNKSDLLQRTLVRPSAAQLVNNDASTFADVEFGDLYKYSTPEYDDFVLKTTPQRNNNYNPMRPSSSRELVVYDASQQLQQPLDVSQSAPLYEPSMQKRGLPINKSLGQSQVFEDGSDLISMPTMQKAQFVPMLQQQPGAYTKKSTMDLEFASPEQSQQSIEVVQKAPLLKSQSIQGGKSNLGFMQKYSPSQMQTTPEVIPFSLGKSAPTSAQKPVTIINPLDGKVTNLGSGLSAQQRGVIGKQQTALAVNMMAKNNAAMQQQAQNASKQQVQQAIQQAPKVNSQPKTFAMRR